MSSRTVYKMPHGRSRKRWSGSGKHKGNRNPKEGELHRFEIPPRETVKAKRLRETMRVKTVAQRRNKRKDRTFIGHQIGCNSIEIRIEKG